MRALGDARAQLVLFGAGHVGKALVRVLADAEVRITWVDTRPEMFGPDIPANVEALASAIPESNVADARPDEPLFEGDGAAEDAAG